MSKAVDILLVSSDANEQKVIDSICAEFIYKSANFKTIDEFMDANIEASILVISQKSLVGMSVAEAIQAAKYTLPDVFLVVIVGDELNKEEATFIRKSGANMIVLQSEVGNSSKLWFCFNQILRATYLPFKVVDLVAGREIPFTIFHLMPQRKKFLPLLSAGDSLTEEKLNKIRDVSEYYFHRTQADKYKKFIDETSDRSANGLAKRCRANFVALQAQFTELVFSITDQSDIASFGEGQDLVNRCRKLCEELLANLAEFPKAWDIISSSAIGEFGSLERATATAAYCGVFGIHADLHRVSELMLVALLVDISILKLPPAISDKIRKLEKLSSEDEKVLRKGPEESLKAILDRKLSLDEKSRSILMSVYEKADGTGYPKGITDLKLSIDSQMIRLARDFDRATLLRLGAARKDPEETLHELIKVEKPGITYSEKFLNLVSEKLLKSEMFK